MKKIAAYQATDGKIFTGNNAKSKVEEYERRFELDMKVEKAIERARILFDVPEVNDKTPNKDKHEESGLTKKEVEFLDKIAQEWDTGEDFENVFDSIVRVHAYNREAFSKFIDYLNGDATWEGNTATETK
jgi:hypothetical protein